MDDLIEKAREAVEALNRIDVKADPAVVNAIEAIMAAVTSLERRMDEKDSYEAEQREMRDE